MDEQKIYFDYKEASYFRSKWGLYIPISIGVIIMVVELIVNDTVYSLAITIPILASYFYSILRKKENADKATEEKIVVKKLQSVINEICRNNKCKVVWKEYVITIPQQQYLPIKRSYYVGLSNGEVRRFKITHANEGRLAIRTQSENVENNEDVAALIKKHKKHDAKAKAERVMAYIAVCVILIGFAVVSLGLWLGNNTTWMKTVGYILIGDFVLALVLAMCLKNYEKRNKVIGIIYKTAQWNLQVLWFILMLIFPSMLLFLGLMVIVLSPFSVVMMALKSLAAVVSISSQTVLFISLTLGAIISAHYSEPLFWWLSRALTANGHRHEKYFKKMVEYVYKPANIQFVVYFLYVVYLVVSTIYKFEMDGAEIIGNDMDLAVLESFLVFIAFSNMKSKRTAADFRFSEIFRIMFGMWTTHDNIEEELKDGEE